MYRYTVCGISVQSVFALPDLVSDDESGSEPDVIIKTGAVPESLNDPTVVAPAYQVADGAFLLTVPNIARYLVRDGREIIVQSVDDVDPIDVRVFLLGSVLGALCHQRGLLPLHASAVVVNGGCAAFVGVSGSGKSTIAALLAQRGYPVISDDICAVSINSNAPLAQPGLARLKLMADVAEALQMDTAELPRDRSMLNKFHLPLGELFNSAPAPLRWVYILREDLPPHSEGIQPIEAPDNIEMLALQTYRHRYAKAMGLKNANFFQCAAVIGATEINYLTRPLEFDHFDKTVAMLEAHWQVG